MNRNIAVVVAAAADNGIGKNNSLPWRLKYGDFVVPNDLCEHGD
jgi:dihydrofolate reductase